MAFQLYNKPQRTFMKPFLPVTILLLAIHFQCMAQQVGIVYTAYAAEDGDGAELLRLFPSAAFKHADPFILLDDFNVQPPVGFPPHEHKGFEAITYMLEGGFVHKDNLGNNDTVFAGGAQRFTAGKQLIHSEMPGTKGINKGLQLWLQVPGAVKKSNASYQKVDAVPVHFYDSSITVYTIAGGNSPLSLQCGCDLTYSDVSLKKDTIDFTPLQGYTSFVYVLEGEIQIDRNILVAGQFYFLSSAYTNSIKTSAFARFIYLSAKPLNQPIKQRGPYVY